MQPEKLIVFGPIMVFFVIFGLIIFGFLVLIFKLIIKSKKSYWKGKVVDKVYRESEDMEDKITQHYILKVDIEGDLIHHIEVNKTMFDDCKVGDLLEKPLNKLQPVKIS